MLTYPDIVFKLSIPEPAAANLSPIQQKFQRVLQHNIQHEGSSILCWAAGQKSVSLMETLLDQYHADVNAVHGDKTPLINAVMSGFLAAVEQVLSRSELDLNYFNQGHRALWYSTAQKDSAIAQRLLRQPGMDINRPLQAKDGKILTIFNEAVIRNNTAVVKVILADERTDLNIAAESMRTPLLCATDRGHLGLSNYCWETRGLTPCAEMLVDTAPSTTRQRMETCNLWTSSSLTAVSMWVPGTITSQLLSTSQPRLDI